MDEWNNILNDMTKGEIGTVRKFMRELILHSLDGVRVTEIYELNELRYYNIYCEAPCKAVCAIDNDYQCPSNLGKKLSCRLGNSVLVDKTVHKEILSLTEMVVLQRMHKLSFEPKSLAHRRRPRHGVLYALHDRMEWNPWISPLWQCKKVYLPIISQKHWLVTIVDMQERIVFVCNNLEIPTAKLGLAIIAEIVMSYVLNFEVMHNCAILNLFAVIWVGLTRLLI
ncbi:hypothetical protein TorRG33x02_271580 [Trema orientale]|uniref:Ulp1 protease family, C-terminal catalytic domain containing protein n=1 Tax=Trema orientale TaxID=63057 RepID=A0A2P5CVM9_TREOI|nr:hypothetical protein TorRG33x02_271580 [Trema orientale]